MAKKKILTEEEKHLKEMAKYGVFYENFKEELHLEDDDTNQLHQLVKAGTEVKKMINDEADKIKVNGFDKASTMLTIDKATWNEFVNMTAKKMYGNLKESAVEKLNDKIETKRYISNLQQAFYDSYLSDETLKKVNESGASDVRYDKEEDTEFAALLEEYAKIKDYINGALKKRLNNLAKAAYFLTDGKLEKKDFKDLVDWEYYKDSEEEPSKSWSIYSKFARMYRILYDYSFEQIDGLDDEFGYEIAVKTPHPKTHLWQIKENETSLD